MATRLKINRKKAGLNKKFRTEYSAGGVVFKLMRDGPRIGFILDPYGKWAFAKGHIEKDEDAKIAALRETSEEMGLKNLKLIKYLGKMDFWFRDRYTHKGALIHKIVYYYLIKSQAREMAKPQKSEKISRVKWVPLGEAEQVLDYKNSKKLLRAAIKIINQRFAPPESTV